MSEPLNMSDDFCELSKKHPVWNVYDEYRTARLNVKYYGRRLAFYESVTFWIDFIIAIAAPTSAAAGFWFLKTDDGQTVWGTLTIIASVTSLVKPILKMPAKIKSMEHSLSGHRRLECDLEEIKDQIQSDKSYSPATQKKFDAAKKIKRGLMQASPETVNNDKLLKKCMTEVISELPNSYFFIPRDNDGNTKTKQTTTTTTTSTSTTAATTTSTV